MREVLPTPVLKMLYFALVHPYFNYCSTVWGSSATVHLRRLVLLQKRAVRVIARVSYLHHTDDLFSELKILNLHDLYNFNTGLYMYKSLNHGDYDCYLREYVLNNTNCHAYMVRNNSFIKLPRYRCERTKSSITYNSCKFWNSLPPNVKTCESIVKFKRKLKTWLLP